MDDADEMKKNGDQGRARIIKIFSKVLPDGSMIEPVASPDGDQLNLLLWNGTSWRIDRQIEHAGCIYQAGKLHESMLRTMRFPREPMRYGSTLQLFNDLVSTWEDYLAFSKTAAERAAYWVFTTCFADCFFSPPALWVCGPDIDRAAGFLGLAGCMCRHSISLAGVTRSGFMSLPMALDPTLLVNQPSLSRSLKSLWCESNFHGSVIPGRGGVLDVACAKAIYVGSEASTPSPGAGNLHLYLSPPDREVSPLNERTRNAIAEYFLGRLLQYRLDHAKEVRESGFVAPGLRLPTRELARKLGACIQGDADLALRVVPLLRPDDDMVGRCNLDCAIWGVVWPRLHSGASKTAAANMKIEAELTADVNTYLLCCGEIRQYSREEVGIRVANLELSRKRTNTGTLLVLDRATSRQVHRLGRSYGLGREVPGCPDCQAGADSIEVTGVTGM